MNCSLFCRQFGVLAYKNFLIKRRHCIVLILELAFPIIVIIALGGLKSIVKPKLINESIPSSYYPSSGTFNNFDLVQYDVVPPCYSANLVWSCLQPTFPNLCTYSSTGQGCKRQHIAVAPSSQSAYSTAASFVSWMYEQSPNAKTYSTFVLFKSEDDFISYIEDSSYGTSSTGSIYSSAIIFNSGSPAWDYTLRMNRTFYPVSGFGQPFSNPETVIPNVDISVTTNEAGTSDGLPYLEAYLQTGQMTLSDLVNSFIASSTCRKTNQCSGGETFAVNTLGGTQFPSPSHMNSGFWGLLGWLFSLIVVISILYPLINVIRALVQEKESKTREGMAMMAMRGDALWMSWVFNFFCLFFPLAILLTIVSTGGKALFSYSFPGLIFIFWLLYFTSSVAFCFFISVFFNKALTGTSTRILKCLECLTVACISACTVVMLRLI